MSASSLARRANKRAGNLLHCSQPRQQCNPPTSAATQHYKRQTNSTQANTTLQLLWFQVKTNARFMRCGESHSGCIKAPAWRAVQEQHCTPKQQQQTPASHAAAPFTEARDYSFILFRLSRASPSSLRSANKILLTATTIRVWLTSPGWEAAGMERGPEQWRCWKPPLEASSPAPWTSAEDKRRL